MAYFNQEKKKQVAPAIKAVLKKYGVKGTLGVNNHSTLVVNIKSGKLDFLEADLKIQEDQTSRQGNYWGEPQKKESIQVNRFHVEKWHRDVGENKIADFFAELIQATLGAGWYDNSDIQTDYFDTAYYININVGKWNKPYELTV